MAADVTRFIEAQRKRSAGRFLVSSKHPALFECPNCHVTITASTLAEAWAKASEHRCSSPRPGLERMRMT